MAMGLASPLSDLEFFVVTDHEQTNQALINRLGAVFLVRLIGEQRDPFICGLLNGSRWRKKEGDQKEENRVFPIDLDHWGLKKASFDESFVVGSRETWKRLLRIGLGVEEVEGRRVENVSEWFTVFQQCQRDWRIGEWRRLGGQSGERSWTESES